MTQLDHKSTFYQTIALIAFVSTGFLLFQVWSLIFLNSQGYSMGNSLQDIQDITQSLNIKGLLILQIISHVFVLILPAWSWGVLFGIKSLNSDKSILDFKTLIICLSILMATFPLVGLTAKLNQLIPLPEIFKIAEDNVRSLMEKLLSAKGIMDRLLLFITIAIVPAISEEWMFRGVLQNLFKNIYHKTWFFVGITALLFSTFHLQFEGFIPRFILGIVLGLTYGYTKNLIYPILIHFAFNGSQILALFVSGKDWMDEQINQEGLNYLDWFTGIIGLVVTATLLYHLHSSRQKDQNVS
ncbi:MAG: CPBP family intramembrane metalloprotease [Saprospiraceae bacterium]|nr:CPBP family intramembrane metalloprotease [Saprospiraceae bacterium]